MGVSDASSLLTNQDPLYSKVNLIYTVSMHNMPFVPQRAAALLTVAAVLLLVGVTAEKNASSISSMSVIDIEDALQVGNP